MVTKPKKIIERYSNRLILAKNHMVTKLIIMRLCDNDSLILAKNHMVTKLLNSPNRGRHCLILAKNHMVTKPQIHVTIYLKIIKY